MNHSSSHVHLVILELIFGTEYKVNVKLGCEAERIDVLDSPGKFFVMFYMLILFDDIDTYGIMRMILALT